MKRLLIPALSVMAVDQATKAIASSSTGGAGGGVILNTGTLAGFIPAQGFPLLLLTSMSLVGFALIGVRLAHNGRASWLALGLLVGGAGGNLIDRVALGHVRDFIWSPWLVVNVADIALAAGAALFIAGVVGILNLNPDR